MAYSTQWDLNKYFYSSINDVQIEKDKQILIGKVDQFVNDYKGKISSLDAREFIQFFELDGSISDLINKIGLYFFYLSSLDTQNQEVIKKQGEFEMLMLKLSNQTLFVSQEFKQIGYQKLMEFSKVDELKSWQNFFVQKASSIKYLLEEKTEFALNIKEQAGGDSFNKMYEELTNSFKFPFPKSLLDSKEQGESTKVNLTDENQGNLGSKIHKKSEKLNKNEGENDYTKLYNLQNNNSEIVYLTEEEIRSKRIDANREVRKAASQSFQWVYEQNANQIVLGNTYNAVVKDWVGDVKIRGFDSVMSPRNISEEMPNSVVDMLMQQVQSHAELFRRYLRTKAKILGYTKLKNFDLYAPINKVEKQMDFEKAIEMVLEVAQSFDSDFYNHTKEMFETGRVDVFPKFGKRGGAFASYTKNFESFVLLNFTKKLDDISTIAHELGHAFHGHLQQNQTEQVYDAGLCLSETASVFSEMLLAEKLMSKLDSKEEKLAFLETRLRDIFATIFTQIRYVAFEKEAHETILADTELTYADFNKMWRKHTKNQLGDTVEFAFGDEKDIGWSAIPHIFRTPFYCYSYAFGNLLTFALYEKYLQEGQKFVEDYKQILASGGSKPPYELLLEHGLDITKPEFYEAGFAVIDKMVSQFEELAENKD